MSINSKDSLDDPKSFDIHVTGRIQNEENVQSDFLDEYLTVRYFV